MHLPILKKENRYKQSLVGFGGINVTQNYSAGEIRDCSGISHKEFPSITQRQKSEHVFDCISPTAALLGNKECIAADDGLYYDRKKVGELSPGKKQLAVLGSKVVVFPDKLYYDTVEEKMGDLCGKCETHGAKVTFTENTVSVPESYYEEKREIDISSFFKEMQLITYETASVYSGNIRFSGFLLKTASELTEGTILREKCKDNQYRIVQSIAYSEENGYYEVVNELVTVENVLEDIFSAFKEGDVVEISGCSLFGENNLSAAILSKTRTSLTFAEGTFSAGSETENIIIQRKIPDFTCICSYENRLWGCEGNTIYASALGDAVNFFVYNNLSTDSFTVTSNSAGDFTACIAYGNCCLFFKENSCYKLFGNRPSNFQLTESFGSGMNKKDSGSLINADGKIIYKGVGGIYVFYGGIPQRISDKLGDITMENSVAGSDGKYYYLSADTKDGRREFVWDIEKISGANQVYRTHWDISPAGAVYIA